VILGGLVIDSLSPSYVNRLRQVFFYADDEFGSVINRDINRQPRSLPVREAGI
jgi:hypothetical protein